MTRTSKNACRASQGDEEAAYRAELSGSGEAVWAAGHLLPELDHADVSLRAVVVGPYSPVGGETGESSYRSSSPGSALCCCITLLERAAVWVMPIRTAERWNWTCLAGTSASTPVAMASAMASAMSSHRGERVGSPVGPAPVGVRRFGVGDGPRFPQGVGTAQFDVRRRGRCRTGPSRTAPRHHGTGRGHRRCR